MKLKRKAQPPVVIERDYRGSVVDLVRVPIFAGVDLPYAVKRRKSIRKVARFIWHAIFRSLLSGMIAGAIIGLGFGVFYLLNSGAHVPDMGDVMFSNGSTLFMDTSLGAMIGGGVGIVGGLVGGAALALLKRDLTEDR
jgi:hypothetical protein